MMAINKSSKKITFILIIYLISLTSFTEKNNTGIQAIKVQNDYNIDNISIIEKQTKGYYSSEEEIINITNGDDSLGYVKLSSPSIVAVADKDYPWGWFQFPSLGINDQGIIKVSWQMKDDSMNTYGTPHASNNSRISLDKGKSWLTEPKDFNLPTYRETIKLANRDFLSIYTQPPVKITSISNFPPAFYNVDGTSYYYESELPEKFKGIYINYYHPTKDKPTTRIHATVKNDSLVRACTQDMISTFWFGKLLEKENDIYAGVYPSYYVNKYGTPSSSAISFYKSCDMGKSWIFQGKIDYQVKYDYYPELNESNKGFSEPTFEFLNDGRILCVMRTSSGKATPMYKSYSSDNGINWTTPEPITPNGVMPQLIKLDEDILVLASGRPGIQLRFSFDGNGEKWSSPIELIDYDEDKNWVYNTCGYPFLYKASENKVYIVYSNFKTLTPDGEYRKSIVFREIQVYRKGNQNT